jgi:hypothetical protein
MTARPTAPNPPQTAAGQSLGAMPCYASLPDHHVRYARAWALHQDADMPDSSREILEREMDSAQNLFGWDEFQKFKATLPGFMEFWADWKRGLCGEPPRYQRGGAGSDPA